MSLVMGLGAVPSGGQQRPFPVVSVFCGQDQRLCRALVQALSEAAPTFIYRINPEPAPTEAFEVHLVLGDQQHAHLRWHGGAGMAVYPIGLGETDLAERLVAASPTLPDALRVHSQP
ncbi:MAG: hypothetical protein AAFY06_09710 [Pseudomonadota bacterium]